jgi:predicted RNA-binding Zn-ribbon protein involved in translation (DUF1610 family)
MNNFEGINTGKWHISETPTGLEAECPVCGYCLPVTATLDLHFFKPQVNGLEDFCPSCGEPMFKNEATYREESGPFTYKGSADKSAKSLVLNCEDIILRHRSLGITLDLSESVDNIDTIEINGVKFVREVQ